MCLGIGALVCGAHGEPLTTNCIVAQQLLVDWLHANVECKEGFRLELGYPSRVLWTLLLDDRSTHCSDMLQVLLEDAGVHPREVLHLRFTDE